MEKSPYSVYIERYFAPVVLAKAELLANGNGGNDYLHKKMLQSQFSVTGAWDNIVKLNRRVAADVVAFDSKLPLKSRASIRKVTGDIPKLGMKLYLNETSMVTLNTLVALKRDDTSVVAELLQDVPAVISGIYERLEACFLQGLSSGVGSIVDSENVGVAIRMDYGYLAENKFKVKELWSDPAYKPLEDIEKVLDKARSNGHQIKHIYMDRATFKAFAQNEDVRHFVASANGLLVTSPANAPKPSLERLNEAFSADSEYGFAVHVIDRRIVIEKDGKSQTITPWEAGKVVFTTTEDVGKLVWADTAEKIYPVSGKTYSTADGYILVSQWRENEPIAEFTSSQARVAPVICNVESIYQLDTKKK